MSDEQHLLGLSQQVRPVKLWRGLMTRRGDAL
jgi:hypothetical protein